MAVKRETSFDVKIWAVRKVTRYSRTKYEVRWTIIRRVRSKTFDTSAAAGAFQADLLSKRNRGEPFDVESGLPVSMVPAPVGLSWWEWALKFSDLKWPHLAPRSRLSLAEALTSVTVAMTTGRGRRPEEKVLRAAMMQWAFVVSRRSAGAPPEQLREAVDWLAAHTRDLADVQDPAVARAVLDALAVKLDGSRAAASTIARKRAVFHQALDVAVEQGHLEVNPLPRMRWRAPKQSEAIDPAIVVTPEQARRLLRAVGHLAEPGELDAKRLGLAARGRQLVAFFGCLYYAGLRPSEAVALEAAHVELPDGDGAWGTLWVSANDPEVTRAWTDTGRREARQLKHRARGSVRPVPCSPQLVVLLRERLAAMGPNPTGRLFRGGAGGPLRENTYTEVWQAARAVALTPAQVDSSLGRRPYDLRHSCVSTWLAAGVDSAQIATWVGHSVQVLHRVYAHVLPGREALAQGKIETFLGG